MPTRRFHNKTRRGCLQCKRKRRKCDEAKPLCLECAKRGVVCSLAQNAVVFIPSSLKQAKNNIGQCESSHSHNAFPSSDSFSKCSFHEFFSVPHSHRPQWSSLSFSMYHLQGDQNDTLRLLQHYSLSTCETISDHESTLPAWRHALPALAFSHNFLLSTILAISSLHLAILSPTQAQKQTHTSTALHHQTQALAHLRPHLTSISPHNASAIFAFSCLTPLFAFGIHGTTTTTTTTTTTISSLERYAELAPEHKHKHALTTLSQIHDIFKLLRGIAAVTHTGAKWPALRFPDPARQRLANPASRLPREIEDSLVLLTRCNETSNTPSSYDDEDDERTAMAETIDILRSNLLLGIESRGNKKTIMPFPLVCPPLFMTRLSAREPLALAVLAHYAVLLHWVRESVWIRSWGRDVVGAVAELLRGEWMECVKWPRLEVGV